MAITPEQFDVLVGKLEAFSRRNPKGYRLRVALFAVLGYVYLFLVLLGLLVLAGLVVLLIVFGHLVNLAMLKFAALLLVPAWAIARSLWVTFPAPQGLKLSRDQVPQLFTLVDELTQQLQAPRFHNILLNQDFNAAVVQVPKLGILGWQENYLLLGLPLMQSLSMPQLKAVLAHELGHLSGNHSRFAAWIYRIRRTWLQIYERLHQSQQQGALILFNRFLDWYWPAFNAYSFILARMNEYEADRCAARLAGAENAAIALINIEIKTRFLEHSFWSDIQKRAGLEIEPPKDTYSSMLSVLHEPIAEEQCHQWLGQALAQKTNNADTHPCLTDRLRSLGYGLDQVQLASEAIAIQTSAAEHLLGKTLQQFAKQFDQDWQTAASTPWRQRYAYLQETKSKLTALAEKAQTQTLTELEAWEQVYYTLDLQGNEVGLPLLQKMLKQHPDHPEANYALGQILLQKADTSGIEYIEKAIATRIDWVIEGCNLITQFFLQQGQPEAAQKYQTRADQHYQHLLKAQQERARVGDRDQFKPHTLTAAEVNDLKAQLVIHAKVKEIYLVEKVVQYFPEKHFCVIGIIRKKGLIESSYAGQNLVQQIIAKLKCPTQAYVIILNNSHYRKLRKKILQVDQALIFRR